MQYMKARKLATGMLVAFLLLSSLALLPTMTVKAAGGSSALVSFNVVDNANAPVAGASASLTETHTSKKYTNTSDTSGLVTFAPLPGYYILKISKSGFFDLEYATVVKFDGLTSVQLNLIQITKLPSTVGTLSVTVSFGGNPVNNVVLKTIDLGSPTKMEKTYSFNGATSQSIHTSTYRLVTSSNGYETDVRDVTISNGVTTNVNIAMNTAVVLNGFVYKAGAPPVGMSAVLVSSNTVLPVEKRIIQPRVSSNYFEFDAFADSNPFYLMVDAVDSLTNLQSLTLVNARTLTVNLTAQSLQTVTSNVVFGTTNWNFFNLTMNTAMDFDASWPNIAYSFLPNLRMQIDFAFGNGDGTVGASEYNAFVSKVRSFGPWNVTSDFIVKVNTTKYVAQTVAGSDFTAISFNGLQSAVTSTAGYTGSMTTLYKSVVTLVNGGPVYNALGYSRYDTNSMDYKLVLTWPAVFPTQMYEMTANTTQTSFVKVYGYTTVTIDGQLRTTGSFEQVTMVIKKSVAPSATAGVGVPSPYTYAVTSGSSVLYYIVSTNRAITFTANGSATPNGNPLKFNWNFGDGTSAGPISSYYTTKTYSAAAFNLTITLIVTDVAGLTATKSFYVKADGVNPVPDFTVRNHTISASAPNLVVNQNEALVFNGASSYDRITSNPNDVGIVRTWTYIWGDGNTTTVGIGENQNVTKTYARAGTFTMLLNVTDAVGHVSTKSIQVLVNDKTRPTVVITITLNGKVVVTAQENQTLVFSANGTKDNVDSFGQLNFTWEFGDGKKGYGPVTSHRYEAIKTFTVKCIARDTSNNSGNTTKSLVITSSPRPDLRVVKITFDPTTFTEGSQGNIKVNLTNVGNDDAIGVVVKFYYLSPSGTENSIGQSSSDQLTVNGTTADRIKPGQFGVVTFPWTPSTKGNFTIVVKASAEREINTVDNTANASLNVNEAAWKSIALYGGIFAVIIVVIVLYYYRKRLPKIGGGGKKPSKEEKPSKPSKEEKSEKGKK